MNFREAHLDDIKNLLELEQCVIASERPYNPELKKRGAFYYDLPKLIASPTSLLLVIEVGNEIIGTGYAQIRESKKSLEHEQHVYLGFMYIAPNYRGQGLNSLLIEKLINWSKHKGISNFYLDVYADNISAVKAYKKSGFKSSLLEMKLSL